MDNDGFVSIGDTVRVRVEGDLVFIRNFRMMTLGDVHAIIELYTRVRHEHGRLFVMYDSSRSQGIEGVARKAMVSRSTLAVTADATAIFGASFAVRTLGGMIVRALVGLGRPTSGVRFFQSESDARNYLQQERFRLTTNG